MKCGNHIRLENGDEIECDHERLADSQFCPCCEFIMLLMMNNEKLREALVNVVSRTVPAPLHTNN
jgi:hypothetical protein